MARVQAQQAAMKAKAAQPVGMSPGDMQSLGEGLGDALRTFKQAVSDVRNSVDPELRTIQAEMDSARPDRQGRIEIVRIVTHGGAVRRAEGLRRPAPGEWFTHSHSP